MLKAKRVAAFAAAIFLLSACSSDYVKIAPAPPDNPVHLGHAEATACGMMGLVGTAYYFSRSA
jgi:hypothetical protein